MTIENKFNNVIANQGLKSSDSAGKAFTPSFERRNQEYIDGRQIPKLSPKYRVALDPKLNDKWNKIQIAVCGINYNSSQMEIGFLLCGEERDDGLIYIDDLIIETTGTRRVSHNEDKIDAIVENLKDKYKNSKPFLIFGHTHPEQRSLPNAFSNSWSVGDFYAMFCAEDRYKNDLQVADLLITPSLDTNLLFYDRNVEGFYRFSQGVYIFENGKWSANECYRDPNLEAKRYNLKNLDI